MNANTGKQYGKGLTIAWQPPEIPGGCRDCSTEGSSDKRRTGEFRQLPLAVGKDGRARWLLDSLRRRLHPIADRRINEPVDNFPDAKPDKLAGLDIQMLPLQPGLGANPSNFRRLRDLSS